MKSHVRILFGTLLMAMASSGLFANSGIFESFIVLNANNGGNTFYDLQANTGNPDFQNANLGSFSCDNTLVLNGGQNKTFKCASDNITGGSLFYRVYPLGQSGGAFNEIGLGFLSNDAGAGNGCQNQTWQNLDANVNLLNGLTGGTYELEVYTQAPYTSNDGPGIRFSSNGGLNYKATFVVGTSGIFESYVVLNSNDAGNVFYNLQASSGNPDFNGTDLGEFSCGDALVLSGGENKIFKLGNHDVTGGSLFYRVYPEGTSPGIFGVVGLNFQSQVDNSTGGLDQTWQTTDANVNLLNGLLAGNYTLEVYTSAPYTFGGCEGTHFSNNGGLNYKANFTVGTPSVANISEGFCKNTPASISLNAAGVAIVTSGDVYNGLFDGCGNVVVTFVPLTFGCAQIGLRTVEVTATDGAGNTAVCNATVNIVFERNPDETPISGCGCEPGEYIGVEISGNVVTGADCLPCPAGFECDGQDITTCPPGTFSTGGAVLCEFCPAGTFQPDFQATSATACLPCEEGSTSESGSGSCDTCLQGYFQSTSDGVTTCTICPPGSYCPDGIVSTPCPAGQFSGVSGAIACAPCEAGTFSSATGATACASCPVGTFQSEAGQTECQNCAAGTANNQTGQISCTPCPAGSFSNTTGQAECSLCPVGTFQNQTGAMACLDCEAGSFNNEPGSTLCETCPEGYFQSIADGVTTCTACPPGTYCPDGIVSLPCPAGQFSGVSGATACASCPVGTFQSEVGQTECQECLAGTANNLTGQISCTPCPAGSFSNTTGQAECSLCPVGTFQSQTGSIACLDCEAGSFNNEPGSTLCETCLPGYFQSTTDGVTTCTICPPGSYCPDGIVSTPCPAGQFSGVSGAIACAPCEAGTFSSATGATACASCPVGTFQSEVGQTECQECLAGTANNLTGQMSCTPCPAGSFSSENGAEFCELCPVGTSNNQLGQVACAACPPGSFSGLEGQAECSLCPVGTFQDQSGSTACLDCDAGSSNNTPGSTSCETCLIEATITSSLLLTDNGNVVIFDNAPASINLASSVTLTASFSTSDFVAGSYQWAFRDMPDGSFADSLGATDADLVIEADGDFHREYQVTVISATGCEAVATIVVFSVDVSCKGANKVLVCHVPPGNPDNSKEICVSVNAVPALLGNSDSYLGSCDLGEKTITYKADQEVQVYPNPSWGRFMLTFKESDVKAEWVEIYDMQSRKVQSIKLDDYNGAFQIELNLSEQENGMYMMTIVGAGQVIASKRIMKTH